MSKSTFVYVTYIRSTPDKVFKALTDKEITRLYWGHDNVSDWKPGSTLQHRRTSNGNVDILGEVVEAKGPHRLVISWASPDAPDKRSRVSFDLEPVADMVKLTVTHDDLERIGDGQGHPLRMAARALDLKSLWRPATRSTSWRCPNPGDASIEPRRQRGSFASAAWGAVSSISTHAPPPRIRRSIDAQARPAGRAAASRAAHRSSNRFHESPRPAGPTRAWRDQTSQCTGRSARPPRSACAFSAFSGPRCMSPHADAGSDLEHHEIEGPSRARMSRYSSVSPVSPLKRRCDSRSHHEDDQSEALPVPGVRPEKCWDGAAVIVTPPCGSSCDSTSRAR